MKIKHCPKCGAEAKINDIMDCVTVQCTNPECRHHTSWYHLYTPWGDCPYAIEDAINEWNEEAKEK